MPPQAVVVTEHQAHARSCPQCGQRTWAEIPAAIRARVLGPNLEAALTLLSAEFHLSRRQVVAVATNLLGLPISLGAVTQYQFRTSAALEPYYHETVHAVRSAAAKNVDETGWPLRGKLGWLWGAATQGAAHFRLHRERRRTSLRALLGRAPRGVICHDRWHAYAQLPAEQSQICWAHLRRDFQALIDRGGPGESLGHQGLAVSAGLFTHWHAWREERLTRTQLQAALEPHKTQLRQALEAARDGPDRKAARLATRLLTRFPRLWTFAVAPGVEPTNNHIERLLRPAVLWRKISNGCQSREGLRFVERALSVIQTLKLQARPTLAPIAAAVTATRSQAKCPYLIPI